MKNILFLPIDNRPITYTLTAQIAAIYKNINLFMPDRKFLGGLLTPSNSEKIIEWFKNPFRDEVKDKKIDFIILSLDTFA
ncbi:MAG: DUF4127 family protein, partial [Candidatus Gastranaerophilales bacterium]|nr:DUF4127 family protein [Candidatus Gastranaerophilales bacterium]